MLLFQSLIRLLPFEVFVKCLLLLLHLPLLLQAVEHLHLCSFLVLIQITFLLITKSFRTRSSSDWVNRSETQSAISVLRDLSSLVRLCDSHSVHAVVSAGFGRP